MLQVSNSPAKRGAHEQHAQVGKVELAPCRGEQNWSFRRFSWPASHGASLVTHGFKARRRHLCVSKSGRNGGKAGDCARSDGLLVAGRKRLVEVGQKDRKARCRRVTQQLCKDVKGCPDAPMVELVFLSVRRQVVGIGSAMNERLALLADVYEASRERFASSLTPWQRVHCTARHVLPCCWLLCAKGCALLPTIRPETCRNTAGTSRCIGQRERENGSHQRLALAGSNPKRNSESTRGCRQHHRSLPLCRKTWTLMRRYQSWATVSRQMACLEIDVDIVGRCLRQ